MKISKVGSKSIYLLYLFKQFFCLTDFQWFGNYTFTKIQYLLNKRKVFFKLIWLILYKIWNFKNFLFQFKDSKFLYKLCNIFLCTYISKKFQKLLNKFLYVF